VKNWQKIEKVSKTKERVLPNAIAKRVHNFVDFNQTKNDYID
jgi:hypothetical protein